MIPSSPVANATRQKLAQLADQRMQPQGEGYTAERHPLMPELILVWAPCGCLWIGDRMDNFITPCGKQECVFKWTDAVMALEALKLAEQAPANPAVIAPTAETAPAQQVLLPEPAAQESTQVTPSEP